MLEFVVGAMVTLVGVYCGATLTGLKKGNNDDGNS